MQSENESETRACVLVALAAAPPPHRAYHLIIYHGRRATATGAPPGPGRPGGIFSIFKRRHTSESDMRPAEAAKPKPK